MNVIGTISIGAIVDKFENNPETTALIGAVIIAAVGALAAYASSKSDKRRNMYADAYKAAIEWREMFYRLRRRSPDKNTGYKLINEFHELQQRIDFYSGWIGSISRPLQNSYTTFVGGIKKETMPHIQKAWKDKPKKIGDGIPREEPQPNHIVINNLSDAFLKDVRRYQSILFFRRILVSAPFYWEKLAVWAKSKKHKRNKNS